MTFSLRQVSRAHPTESVCVRLCGLGGGGGGVGEAGCPAALAVLQDHVLLSQRVTTHLGHENGNCLKIFFFPRFNNVWNGPLQFAMTLKQQNTSLFLALFLNGRIPSGIKQMN